MYQAIMINEFIVVKKNSICRSHQKQVIRVPFVYIYKLINKKNINISLLFNRKTNHVMFTSCLIVNPQNIGTC
jgi:hypothetical protein